MNYCFASSLPNMTGQGGRYELSLIIAVDGIHAPWGISRYRSLLLPLPKGTVEKLSLIHI